MSFQPLNTTEIMSGVLAMAADDGERLSVPRIHATLRAMQPVQRLLTPFHFHPAEDGWRSVEVAFGIAELIQMGVIAPLDDSTLEVRHPAWVTTWLGSRIDAREFSALLILSMHFYEQLRS